MRGAQRELLTVRAERQRLALEQELGKVVDVTQVSSFIARVVTAAASKLDELPDRVDAVFSDVVDTEKRRTIRSMVADVVDGVRQEIAELVTGDEDEGET